MNNSPLNKAFFSWFVDFFFQLWQVCLIGLSAVVSASSLPSKSPHLQEHLKIKKTTSYNHSSKSSISYIFDTVSPGVCLRHSAWRCKQKRKERTVCLPLDLRDSMLAVSPNYVHTINHCWSGSFWLATTSPIRIITSYIINYAR